MRTASMLACLVLSCGLATVYAQSTGGRPRPEVVVAPAYPREALARRIETEVVVQVFVDYQGNVTRAEAVEGPCRYSSPAPEPSAAPCEYGREAAAHRATGQKFLKESQDSSLPEAERKSKFKQFDSEQWLAAQYAVYDAAERAARKWVFESMDTPKPPGSHIFDLRFRFRVGRTASIETTDPWTVVVTGALYPSIQD